ncbi:hypothetical protein [Clostridium manihotivorum]|uniref:hypothetical protein n=1 Tax=Clostridium manihotivorum TaxID=2320868 RepID=UPI001EE5DC96|nr:hypothetical protein [Clostridium manihotivorum]
MIGSKKSEELFGPDWESKFTPRPKDSKELPLSTVAELLDVNRTSAYYKSKSPSETELAIKDSIDRMHTDNPSWGSRADFKAFAA